MDMRKMEELKEKLIREMEIYSSKSLTMADITFVDTLAHATKNLCKVMEMEEEEMGESYRGGYSNRHRVKAHYSRDGGESYARGMSHGNASYRDMLEDEYANARDERERDVIRRMMDRM